jgi:hypothetical protein
MRLQPVFDGKNLVHDMCTFFFLYDERYLRKLLKFDMSFVLDG